MEHLINSLLKDIAEKENMSIQSSASLKDLVALMNVNRKGVVVILDDTKPSGILTERDIVEILHKGICLEEKIDKYAKFSLVVTVGTRTVGYALNLTLENNIRRVIVVDDSSNFLGIVTQQDLLKYLEEDFYRLTIKIKHILEKERNLLSVSSDKSLQDVLDIMFTNKISAVPVLEEGKAVGIITEKDMLKFSVSNTTLEGRVTEYMSSPVETAGFDSLLIEVVEVMNYKNIRRIVVIDDEGSAINIVTIRDVIENLEGDYNKFMERKLRTAKEILNLLPEMLIEVTDTGREQLIIWVNDKVLSTFGREILDKPVTGLLPHETWNYIHSTLTTLGKIEHIKLKIKDRIYELSGFFISTFWKMEQGRFQLIMRDITDDVMMLTVDPLTNIYNRRFINGFLLKELERGKRLERHFAVVISDIDNFKKINDAHGHLSGDLVLQSLARLMTGTVRKLDVVGRYGGDEFMIILPDSNKESALKVMDRLRVKVQEVTIKVLKEAEVKISASFGISFFPEDGSSLEDLLVAADERLYKAKRLGKNQITCI